jgi:DNA-binding CsgD family transcriptional regulator
MARRSYTSVARRERIAEYLEMGLSVREIATREGMTEQAIYYHINNETGLRRRFDEMRRQRQASA